MPFLIETKKWGNTLYLTPSGGWSCAARSADRFEDRFIAQRFIDETGVLIGVAPQHLNIVEHTFEMERVADGK